MVVVLGDVLGAATMAPLRAFLGLDELQGATALEASMKPAQTQLAQKSRTLLEAQLSSEDVRFQGASQEVVLRMIPGLTPPLLSEVDPGPRRPFPGVQARGPDEVQQAAAGYREMFARCLRGHYEVAVNDGILPRGSAGARTLLASAEAAIEAPEHALQDWAFVERRLFAESSAGISAAKWPLRRLLAHPGLNEGQAASDTASSSEAAAAALCLHHAHAL